MLSTVSTHFYLGANSPNGFFSLFDWLLGVQDADNIYLIKGSAGCGKSSFMRKIGEYAESKGYAIEYIRCSSDPDSLDGVVIPAVRTAFVDATAPHIIEPKYAIALESYINLGDYVNRKALKEYRSDIIAVTDEYRAHYEAAYRLLAAAKSLEDDNFSIAVGAVDFNRLTRRASGVCKREFKKILRDPKEAVRTGKIEKRFISSISYKGYQCEQGTVNTLCDRVYELKTNYGLSRFWTSKLQSAALDAGYDVISCCDPMNPEGAPEHIIIPELKLGFVTSSDLLPYEGTPYRRIHMDAMLDKSKLSANRARLRFTKRMTRSIIQEAVVSLEKAKTAHDKLEKLYNPHVNFKGVYALADKFCKELF